MPIRTFRVVPEARVVPSENPAEPLSTDMRFVKAIDLETKTVTLDTVGACPECGGEFVPQGGTFATSTVCQACGLGHEYLMRVLPCDRCGKARTADGEVYLMGGDPSRFPFSYQCARCKATKVLTATDFNMIPLLGPAEYAPMLPKAKDTAPGGAEVVQRFLPVKDPDPVKRLGRLIVRGPDKSHEVPVRRIPVSDIGKHVPKR